MTKLFRLYIAVAIQCVVALACCVYLASENAALRENLIVEAVKIANARAVPEPNTVYVPVSRPRAGRKIKAKEKP